MATLLEGIQQEREEERLEQQQAQVEADVISSQVHGMTKAEALAFVGVLGLKDTYRGVKQILGVDTEDLKEEQEKLNLILQQYGAEAFAAFAGGAILDPVGWIIPVGKARTVGKLAIMGAAFAGGSSFLGYTDENTIERRLVNAGIGTVAGGVATPILGKSFQGISALAQKGRTSFAGRSGRLLELGGEDAFGFEKGFNFKEAVKSVSDLPNKRRIADPIKGLYQDVLGKPLKNFVFNHPGAMITGGIGGVAGADYGDYTVDKNVEQWTIDYAEGNISKEEYDQKLKDFKENEDSIRRNFRIMGFVTGAILGVGVKRTVAGFPAGKLTSLYGGKERDLTIGEYLSRGLFDNYGLEPDYIALKEMSNLQGNHIMKQLATVSDQVSHLTRDQRKVMTDVLDGKEDFLPSDVRHLDGAFMDQLDKTGQSLIDFGMISVEELQKRITRYAFSLQNRGLDSKQAVTRLTEISNSKISQINSRADIRRFTLSKQIDNLNRRKVKLQAKALKQEETKKEIFDTEDARELDELIPSKIDKLEADMLNTNLDRVDAIKEAKVDLRAQLAKERARNLEFKEGLVSGKLTDQDIENKLLRLSTISNNLNNRGLRMDIRINEVKGFLQEGWTLEQVDKPILGNRALNRIANAEARALERGATKEEIDRISDAAILRETQKAQLRMLKEGDARIVEDTVTIRKQLKPDEKIAMGELDDASYVIGRFGRLLADDVQKFRFYHSLNEKGFGLTEQEAKTINDAVNPLSKDDIESIRKFLLSKFRAGTGEERALSSEQIERLVSIEKYLSEKNKNVLRNVLSERVKKVQGQAAFTEEEIEGIISNISSFDRTSILASFPDFVQKAVARGENFVQVPTTMSNRLNVPTYGKMAGLWVPENVLSDLQWSNAFYKLMNDSEVSSILRGLRTLQRTWKASKTAWNPTVHMNNIMGNVVLYDFHDANWKFIGPSARELFKVGVLGKPSKLIDDAKAAGVFGADFVTRELGAAEGRLLREYGNKNWTDNIEGSLGIAATIADTIAKRTKIVEGIKKAVGVRTGYLARLYQSEDSVFRLAAFQTKLEQGFSPQEAARFARKAFVDYNINAPLINVMRETTTPFLAYSYRIMPIIAESAIMKPWKLAKYAALGYGLNAIGTDVTNSDESAIRAVLPERFRGNIWGDPTGILPPRFISMPITVNGVPQYKDFTRWIPGGDVFEMGKGLIPYIPRPLQPNGGLWGAIGTGLMGYDNFTGKKIPGLGFGESRDFWARVQFVGDSLIPNFPFVPGAPSTVKINRAFVKGQVNPFIDPIPVWQAIMQSVGIKLTPANVDTLTTSTLAEYGGQLNSARQGMVNLIKGLQQNQISMEQYEKGILRIEAIVSRLTEELNKKLEPQKKTKQNKQEGGEVQGLADGGPVYDDGGEVQHWIDRLPTPDFSIDPGMEIGDPEMQKRMASQEYRFKQKRREEFKSINNSLKFWHDKGKEFKIELKSLRDKGKVGTPEYIETQRKEKEAFENWSAILDYTVDISKPLPLGQKLADGGPVDDDNGDDDLFTLNITPTEKEYFNVIFNSEGDLSDLREDVPSAKFDFDNSLLSLSKADAAGFARYIAETLEVHERGNIRLPPRFTNDKLIDILMEQADEETALITSSNQPPRIETPFDEPTPPTLGSNILKFAPKVLGKALGPIGQYFSDTGTIPTDVEELAPLRRQELLKRFNKRTHELSKYDFAVQEQKEGVQGRFTQEQQDFIRIMKQVVAEKKFQKTPTFTDIESTMMKAERVLYPDGSPRIGPTNHNRLYSEILNEAIQKFGGTIQTKPGVEEEPPKVLDETDIEFAELLIDNLQKLEGRESIDKYNDIAEKYRTTKSIRGRKALLDRFKKLLNPGPTLVE